MLVGAEYPCYFKVILLMDHFYGGKPPFYVKGAMLSFIVYLFMVIDDVRTFSIKLVKPKYN
jgi:hypothetical protein